MRSASATKGSRLKAKAALSTGIVALLVASPAAIASPPEVGHFSGQETFGPQVITDLPCLEGKEFVLTGLRGNDVNSEQFFHFAGITLFTYPVNDRTSVRRRSSRSSAGLGERDQAASLWVAGTVSTGTVE